MLRNRLGLQDAAALSDLEAQLAGLRSAQLLVEPLAGSYDYAHLQRFHRFLFAAVYDWAGVPRTVAIAKSQMFCLPQHLASNAASMFARLTSDRLLLAPTSRHEFVEATAGHIAEINALHPFREGNGRTQRAFFGQLARGVGYHIRWDLADRAANDHASERSLISDNGPLRDLLDELIVPLS